MNLYYSRSQVLLGSVYVGLCGVSRCLIDMSFSMHSQVKLGNEQKNK